MQITEEQLKALGELADTCDNLIGEINAPGTGDAHIERLRTGLEGLSAQLKALVVSISGDDPWAGFS